MRIVHGNMETRHFVFDVYGTSEAECKELMRAAWRKHCEQTDADPEHFDGESFNMTSAEIGSAYRDGDVLVNATPVRPSATHEQRIEQLELLMDAVGLSEVLGMVAEVCGLKADHLRSNWQDDALGKVWDKMSKTVGRTRTSVLPYSSMVG